MQEKNPTKEVGTEEKREKLSQITYKKKAEPKNEGEESLITKTCQNEVQKGRHRNAHNKTTFRTSTVQLFH